MLRNKRSDWWERLSDYVEEARHRKTDWKTFDCCVFVAGAAEVLCGTNPYGLFEIEYWDKESALRAVYQYSGGRGYAEGLVAIVEDKCSEVGATVMGEVPTARGDILVAMVDNLPVCGVCVGDKAVFLQDEIGIAFRKLAEIDILTKVRF